MAKNVFRQNQYPNHNFELDIVEDRQYVTKTVDISTPPPAYHLVGANLKWGPYDFLSSKVNISLSIDNLFDSSYRNYLNRLRYYADEQGRNVLLQIKFSY
jgi:iron complex outermembrane receptor protein